MDMLHTSEVMVIFVIFGLFSPNFGSHGNVYYTLAITNVFFGFVVHENPVLYVIAFSLSLVETVSDIAIFVLKRDVKLKLTN